MTKLFLRLFLLLTQSFVSQNSSLLSGIDLTQSNPKFENILKSEENNIYWLGEQHGTQDNYIVAIKLLTFLTKEIGIDYLIIENSYLTEILLNKYLETGDVEFLNQSIKNYSGTFYTNNELRTYLESVYKLWKELPENQKFRFISIDIEQTYNASKKYIHSFLKEQELEKKFEQNIDFNSEKDNQSRIKYYSLLQNFLIEENTTNDTVAYMVQNMKNVTTAYIKGERWDEVRDSLIFENFKIRDKTLDFKNKTSFALWGIDHCYKSKNKNDVKWIASLIKEQHPEIKQNSTVILYDKSDFMRHKSTFPKISRFLFKKIDENFIRHKYQNEPFNKLKDKRFLKKHKLSDLTMWSVKDLNPKWNFVTKKIKDKITSDYVENVVLVTDSRHCTPYYEN